MGASINNCTAAALNGPWCSADRQMDGFQQTDAPEKTDFLWCATCRRSIHLDTGELSVCGVLIRPSTSVRDLGLRRHITCRNYNNDNYHYYYYYYSSERVKKETAFKKSLS